jgi:glucose-1-phosphate thymidylyltransferase
MKGIILAGGSGSRLWPVTKATSKQLLPVFDKPLIYYPLSTLMLAGIREILIITTEEYKFSFRKVLGDGSQWNLKISYDTQPKPEGLAQGLIIGEKFLDGDSCCFILGDNIFHGPSLGKTLSEYKELQGAQIFGYEVAEPHRYGIVEVDEYGEVVSIVEKPENPKSNLAITGLYFYDAHAPSLAKTLTPSKRGELEITDLNNLYLKANSLHLRKLPHGTAWFDTGTFNSLHDASSYIRILQERQGSKVADLDQIAHDLETET